MVDEVGTHDFVAIEQARDLELRANAVRRRDEDLVGARGREQPAELADLADDLGAPSARDTLLDLGKRVLGARDVHAGVAIGEAHAFTGSLSSESFPSSSWTGTR